VSVLAVAGDHPAAAASFRALYAFVNFLRFGCDKTTEGFLKAHIEPKRRIELRPFLVDDAIKAL
jgi:hypothetical protein